MTIEEARALVTAELAPLWPKRAAALQACTCKTEPPKALPYRVGGSWRWPATKDTP